MRGERVVVELGGGSLHGGEQGAWVVTTHDWAVDVDRVHLGRVRAAPAVFSPGGWGHLVLEVMAYADDEAAALGRRGRVWVVVHGDGSVEVGDDGRGTDTRVTTFERVVRKPVASSQDVRFTADRPPVVLPDGYRRRGLSVVAALSRWLVHTNRRGEGSWSQRYEHGVPVTDLVPVAPDGTTGTTMRFLPDDPADHVPDVMPAMAERFPNLTVAWTTAGA